MSVEAFFAQLAVRAGKEIWDQLEAGSAAGGFSEPEEFDDPDEYFDFCARCAAEILVRSGLARLATEPLMTCICGVVMTSALSRVRLGFSAESMQRAMARKRWNQIALEYLRRIRPSDVSGNRDIVDLFSLRIMSDDQRIVDELSRAMITVDYYVARGIINKYGLDETAYPYVVGAVSSQRIIREFTGLCVDSDGDSESRSREFYVPILKGLHREEEESSENETGQLRTSSAEGEQASMGAEGSVQSMNHARTGEAEVIRRLGTIEELLKRNMISEDEYHRKRQDIINNI